MRAVTAIVTAAVVVAVAAPVAGATPTDQSPDPAVDGPVGQATGVGGGLVLATGGATRGATDGHANRTDEESADSVEIRSLEAPDVVTAGESFVVRATVGTAGDATASTTVDYHVDADGDGTVTDDEPLGSAPVRVASTGTETVAFTVDTDGVPVGTFRHGVATGDDVATATIRVAPVGPPNVTVRLAPRNATVGVGRERAVDVVAEGADAGVRTYDVELALAGASGDATPVELVAASPAGEPAVDRTRIDPDGTGARLLVSGVEAEPVDGRVVLATVRFRGAATGEAHVDVSVDTLRDVDGEPYDSYSYGGVDGTVTVVEGVTVPPVTGERRPGNVDDDPQLEDVDGDGDFDIFDVQTFLERFEGSVVTEHPAAFDFDGSGDGEVTIFDVQALLTEL